MPRTLTRYWPSAGKFEAGNESPQTTACPPAGATVAAKNVCAEVEKLEPFQ